MHRPGFGFVLDQIVKTVVGICVAGVMDAGRFYPLRRIAAGGLLAGGLLLVLLPVESVMAILWFALMGGGLAFWIDLRRRSQHRCMKLTPRCDQNVRSRFHGYERKGWNTPECCASHLVHTLFTVCRLLERDGIPYFIAEGTLLGAVRHRGLIPWDTDCDIVVAEEHLPRLRRLIWPLILRGLWVYEHAGTFTVQYSAGGINSLHTDVYLSRGDERGGIAYDEREHVARKHIFPLRRYTFCRRPLWGPWNAKALLHDFYGSDCLEKGRKKHLDPSIAFPILSDRMPPAGSEIEAW